MLGGGDGLSEAGHFIRVLIQYGQIYLFITFVDKDSGNAVEERSKLGGGHWHVYGLLRAPGKGEVSQHISSSLGLDS